MELQKLSVQFRKQQKKYLMDISHRDGASGGFAVLEETGRRAGQDEEYDPGFSETQASSPKRLSLLMSRCLPRNLGLADLPC